MLNTTYIFLSSAEIRDIIPEGQHRSLITLWLLVKKPDPQAYTPRCTLLII